MSNKGIYNKLPEGYVPVPKFNKSTELKLLKQGSVTEITLDGKSFQVFDANKVQQLITLVERHDDSLFNLRQENNQLKRKIQELTNKVNILNQSVNRLQEQVKNAGFDRF